MEEVIAGFKVRVGDEEDDNDDVEIIGGTLTPNELPDMPISSFHEQDV